MPTLRRMTDEELSAILALLAAQGGTARTPESWQQDHMTALILGDKSPPHSPIAAMPISQRKIHPAPGREISAGWLSSNQFASRISLRRQTRSTSAEWPTLLPEVDALIVLRRDEPSFAGRWYTQTGFHDVLAIRCLYLDMHAPPAAPPSAQNYHAQVITPGDDAWTRENWQAEMFSVYHDVYGSCGGAPTRSPTFWESTLANHYYRDHYQFQIIGLWSPPPSSTTSRTPREHPSLMGYAVVGWSGWHSKRPRMDILELATRQWDTAVAGHLIQTTCQLAWSKNVQQVRAVISAHDPYRGHLARTGFVDRWGYRMLARWLHPQHYLDRLAASLPSEAGDFWLQLHAPGEVPLSLGRGARSAPAKTISLHADSRTITRLLLNRTDILAALRDGTLVPATPLADQDLARLSACFPWAPWVFHMLDYI